MIVKCDNNHYDKIMKLARKEPSFNLFIIADIEKYGVAASFLDTWGDFYDDGTLRAVLLRYHANFLVYTNEDTYEINGFTNILKSAEEFKVLSGKREIIKQYKKRINFKKTRNMYFSVLKKEFFNPKSSIKTDIKIKRASPDDAKGIYKLRKKIKEFEIPTSVVSIRKRLKDEFGRTFIIKKDQDVIAAASTTAECSFSAMIGGVMTDPSFREKGYASICITELCKELLNENKTACLFYDNPSAGSIYRNIGFKDIGAWTMCMR